eukprot:scaffold3554_cov61-Phaeocystis_antarctica.AAC.4
MMPKGDSHVFTVWRAEVNTRIHVRIQLQSKYVEYVLPCRDFTYVKPVLFRVFRPRTFQLKFLGHRHQGFPRRYRASIVQL